MDKQKTSDGQKLDQLEKAQNYERKLIDQLQSQLKARDDEMDKLT